MDIKSIRNPIRNIKNYSPESHSQSSSKIIFIFVNDEINNEFIILADSKIRLKNKILNSSVMEDCEYQCDSKTDIWSEVDN